MVRPWVIVAACLVVAQGQAVAEVGLYDRLGQEAGLARIAARAVALWRADPRVQADFADINPDRLQKRLTDQLCQLAGGPCVYKGRSMHDAHAGLQLDQRRFNAVAEDLQDAMDAEGVPYWTQNHLLALLAPMQRDVVER